MPLAGSIVDTFDAPPLAAHWTYVSGDITVTGEGRLRVHPAPTDGYGQCQLNTAENLTLDGAPVRVQVPTVAPDPGGYAVFRLMFSAPGTATASGTPERASIVHEPAAGNLVLRYEVNYAADAGTVYLPYSATDHQWWGFRVEAGDLLFETSPDGLAWTVQRTSPAPAWMSADTAAIVFEGYCPDAGPDTYAELDNLNATPGTGPDPDDGTPVVREVVGGTANPDDANGGALTVATSAAVEVGDLLVAFQGHDWGTAAEMLAPGGTDAADWVLAASGNPNAVDQVHEYVWLREVATAGVQTITDSGAAASADITLHVVVLDGATVADVALDGAAGTADGGVAAVAAHVAPSVIPDGTANLLLCGFASQGTVDYTGPAGMAPVGAELDSRTYITQRVYSEVLDAAGATGTRTATAVPDRSYAAATVAIRGVPVEVPAEYVGPADGFDDGTLDAWPDSYGNVSVVAGRGRVTSTSDAGTGEPQWAGIEYHGDRTLAGRRFLVEVPEVAPLGDASSASTAVWVWSVAGGGGARVGWQYLAETGQLRAEAQTDYYDAHFEGADPEGLLTYSPTTHRWWLIEHTGSTIRWSTSATGEDGDWIARRVLATPPAWVANEDTAVALESFRWDATTAGVAEFDNANLPPADTGGPEPASASSDGTAAGSATPARVVPATAAGRVSSTGRAGAQRVVLAAGQDAGTAAGTGHAGQVAAGSAASSALADGAGHPAAVGRAGARSRAVALGTSVLAAVRRAAALAAGTVAGRAAWTRVDPAGSAHEDAHTAASATLGGVTPAGAREDATVDARAHADPIGTDPAASSASTVAAGHALRVVPLAARGTATATGTGHPAVAGRPRALGLVEVDSAGHGQRIGHERATDTATADGWVGAPNIATRLAARATAGSTSHAHPRAVGAGTAHDTAGTDTGTPAQRVAPVAAARSSRARAHTRGLPVRQGHARDAAGSSSVATPRTIGRPHALAGAQVHGDATARAIGAPTAHGLAGTTQSASPSGGALSAARADATASGWARTVGWTAAGRARGTATAAGSVGQVVDLPGDLAPAVSQSDLVATAAPGGLTATAHPATLEVSTS